MRRYFSVNFVSIEACEAWSVWNLLIQHIIIFARRNSQHFYSTERANNHKFIPPAIWQLKVSRMSLFYCRRLYSLLGIIKRQYRLTSAVRHCLLLFLVWAGQLNCSQRVMQQARERDKNFNRQMSAMPEENLRRVWFFLLVFWGNFHQKASVEHGKAGMHVRGLWILLAR